jgi:hypothetical protein
MRILRIPLSALCLLTVLPLSAATRIDDPKAFVTEVYRRFTAESTGSKYQPPEDIYTPGLKKLIHDDRRKAKGEVGCLDFVFWLGAQDWKITGLAITSTEELRRTPRIKF